MTAGARAHELNASPGKLPGLVRRLSELDTPWLLRFRVHLRDRRFWTVQLMIVVIALVHTFGEWFWESHLGWAYFIPASLYFFPVLYASLNFGVEGALPTALWSGFIAVPDVMLSHHGLQRVGESFQLVMTIFVALVVATRVDKEISARVRAEASEQARAFSELKYQALFDGAGEPILVLDSGGVVRDANAAAGALLAADPGTLVGQPASALLGTTVRGREPARSEPGASVAADIGVRRPGGEMAWFQPVITAVQASGQIGLVQVLLRDVTERRGFQSYAQEIVRAQEEERQRIAHELHDVSLQSAVLICRRLDAAADAAERGEERTLASMLADARLAAESMGDELRRFSRDLRPLILEDLGLVPAIKRLVTELRDRSSIECRLTVSGGTRRLDPAVELALFRIAQEALRNVERHSGATRAAVRLTHHVDHASLTVSDNGGGFDLPPLNELVGARRLGLLGMRERARLVGGGCEIRSSQRGGTRVEVRVPGGPALKEAGLAT